MFCHLHTHSHYSLLDGLPKIPDIVNRAKELGMTAVALTDHGTTYGLIEFYKACKKADIKPILGVEAYVARRGHTDKEPGVDTKPYHLVLLAKNKEGYENILRLTSIAHLDGFYYKPRIDKELLKKYGKGIIGLSACLNGEIARAVLSDNMETAERALAEYKDIFGEGNFYLEIQPQTATKNNDQSLANARLIELAKKTNTPLVATKDVHYINFEDKEAQDALLCIQTGTTLDNPDRLSMMDIDCSFSTEGDMREWFPDTPEAIENTEKIAEACNVELELGGNILPKFKTPNGKSDVDYLRELCEEGVKKRYKEITPEVRERLEWELDTINKMGFASYFLIVADFVKYAKGEGIVVGPGRGSAAGSIVSYVLRVTDLDPIHYKLLFERFLNPDRISMPDIDMDFADIKRHKVIEYVMEKYGRDKVAGIITFGTMMARAAVRDVGRVMGLPYGEVDRIAKMIPTPVQGRHTPLSQHVEEVKELRELYNDNPDIKRLLDLSIKMEGTVRHASQHACAVVIADKPLMEYTAIQKAQGGDVESVTQYSMKPIEDVGLLKMDFLGLSNLSIIQDTIEIVEAVSKIETGEGTKIDIEKIPLNDKKTFNILSRAETTGVFQLESSGMKRYIKELQPTDIEDIIAMVALYRPGPMQFIESFINRKHGREKIKYMHPSMENALKNTYGIPVYQEQVMQISKDMAGFTGGEADTLRKAMGKKIAELMAKMRAKFIAGATTQGISKQIAIEVFKTLEDFAAYGFNRCLTGDTEVVDIKTGKKATIVELYKDNKLVKNILALEEGTLKFKKAKIEKVFSNGIKAVYELTTKLGRKIKATDNHPFFMFDGWVLLKDLKIGDKIAVPRELNLKLNRYEIDDKHLILLGYLIAEGNLCHPHTFYFYSSSKEEIDDYVSNLERFDNTRATINHKKKTASIHTARKILNQKSEAIEWIRKIGVMNKRATEKELPDFVYELNERQLSLLISKIFQGDGCITVKRKHPEIYYATSSIKLSKQIHHLLLRLNIVSSIKKKKFKYRGGIKIGYTLHINRYSNIETFITKIGCYFVGQKKRAIKHILKTHPILNGTIKANAARGSRDIVPIEILSLIKKEIQNKGYALRSFARKYRIAERLLFADKIKKGFLRETLGNIADILKSKEIKKYAKSDIYWDEIASIKYTGEEKTYDLTVSKYHNFVANDIVVHNSHAACYAMIAYRTAYLKANWPNCFMAALMNSDYGNLDRITIEVEECKSLGLEVLPPDINESYSKFSVVPKTNKIRFGLLAIKNVGSDIADAIIKERKENGKFESSEDFLERINHKNLNKKSLDALVKCGAMDALGARAEMLHNMQKMLDFNREIRAAAEKTTACLFGGDVLSKPTLQMEPAEPIEKKEILAWEKELLGLYVSAHPFLDIKPLIADLIKNIDELKEMKDGNWVNVAGVITKIHSIRTKKNEPMCFVTIEDGMSSFEIVVFPGVLEGTRELWQEDSIVIVGGRLSFKDGEIKVLANKVEVVSVDNMEKIKSDFTSVKSDKSQIPNPKSQQNSSPQVQDSETISVPTPNSVKEFFNGNIALKDDGLYISLPKTMKKAQVEHIKLLLQKHPGDTQVFLALPDKPAIKTSFKVDAEKFI